MSFASPDSMMGCRISGHCDGHMMPSLLQTPLTSKNSNNGAHRWAENQKSRRNINRRAMLV
jgi:hypothetical protein